MGEFDPARYPDPWTLRSGEQVFATKPRPTVYRVWSMNHLIHHRSRLCVYLRLLGVRVPTVYFNTADDPAFVFE
ncbi:MAG TPA: DinB family protein [Tepidisphaeraceae bacterium]|nr:DinB family protein [Tepidisphaeraceae bacterium]